MAKSKLIVVHGMGVHSASSIKKTVVDAANEALHRYPGYNSEKFENHVDVIGVGFDDIFEKERKRLKQNNESLSDYLKGNSTAVPKFIQSIVSLENEIGKEAFFATHAFDVLLYLTLKGPEVRLRILEKIAKEFDRRRDESIHVMAHSLGTAVLHDTLHKAYKGGITDSKAGYSYKLDCVDHKFDSLWMVANVSNLTATLSPFGVKFDPYDSLVRPSRGNDGCAKYLYNLRHALDPFTKFYPFKPKKDDGWVPKPVFDEYYRYIRNTRIGHTLNPHSLAGYLLDPNVSYRFLARVMPFGTFMPTGADADKADAKFKDVVGEAKRIAEHVSNIRAVDDVTDFVMMVKDYEEYIEQLKLSL